LCALLLSGCASPLAKSLEPTAVIKATPTKAAPVIPTLEPTATLQPTQSVQTAPVVDDVQEITVENAQQLSGTVLALPAPVWKLLWPAPDRLRVLLQPETPSSAAVREYSLHPLKEIPDLVPFDVPENLLDIAPDASRIAIVDENGQVKLVGANGEAQLLPVNSPVYGGFFADDSSKFVTTSAAAWEATVWDVTGSALGVMNDFETAAPVYGAYAGYDTTLIWVARATLQVDDWQTGENRFRLGYMDFIMGWSFAPGSQRIALAVEGKVRVLDLIDGTELWAADAPGVYNVAYSPNGQIVAGAGSQGILLWDAQNGQLLATLPADVVNLGFSPDGTTLVGALNNGGIEIWQ